MIKADKARARGDIYKGCRCGDRLRAKAGKKKSIPFSMFACHPCREVKGNRTETVTWGDRVTKNKATVPWEQLDQGQTQAHRMLFVWKFIDNSSADRQLRKGLLFKQLSYNRFSHKREPSEGNAKYSCRSLREARCFSEASICWNR